MKVFQKIIALSLLAPGVFAAGSQLAAQDPDAGWLADLNAVPASPHVHWAEGVSSQSGPRTLEKEAKRAARHAARITEESEARMRAQKYAREAAARRELYARSEPVATQDPGIGGWGLPMLPDSEDTQEASPPMAAAAGAGASGAAVRRHSTGGSALRRSDSGLSMGAGRSAPARRSAPAMPSFDAAEVLALSAAISAVAPPSAVRRSDAVQRLASLPGGAPTQSEVGPIDGQGASQAAMGLDGAGAAEDSDSGDSGLGQME